MQCKMSIVKSLLWWYNVLTPPKQTQTLLSFLPMWKDSQAFVLGPFALLLGLGRGVPLHLFLIPHPFFSHSWKGNSKEEIAFPSHAQLLEGSSGSCQILPEEGIQEKLFPAPSFGSYCFGWALSKGHLLCTVQGLALALCPRWRPKRQREDVYKRGSRENVGLHSLSNGLWRHPKRQLPNWQGLSRAAVLSGTGSSTHTAEQGCAICHPPVPASSL